MTDILETAEIVQCCGFPVLRTALAPDELEAALEMVSDHPEIAELDINPLIVCSEDKGCVVADSQILLKRVEQV